MYIDSKGLFEYSNWFRFQENLKQQWYWNWITETYWFRFQEKKKPQTAMILKLGYWIYVTKNRERNWKCNHLVTDSTADWLGRGWLGCEGLVGTTRGGVWLGCGTMGTNRQPFIPVPRDLRVTPSGTVAGKTSHQNRHFWTSHRDPS